MSDTSLRICNALDALTTKGGSVKIWTPDDKFNDYLIEITADWTNWKPVKYGEESLLEVLEFAVREKVAAT